MSSEGCNFQPKHTCGVQNNNVTLLQPYGENDLDLTTRERSFLRAMMHRDYLKTKHTVVLQHAMWMKVKPTDDLLFLYDYTKGAVKINLQSLNNPSKPDVLGGAEWTACSPKWWAHATGCDGHEARRRDVLYNSQWRFAEDSTSNVVENCRLRVRKSDPHFDDCDGAGRDCQYCFHEPSQTDKEIRCPAANVDLAVINCVPRLLLASSRHTLDHIL
ncbi:hypothetical protein C8R44DRAFT_748525 [Mycena epipterygia]|nr:hypothetical protein C8R44DRAFT_748525 [Mycena epipterygia]